MIYLFASGKGRQESKVSKKQSIIKKWQKACLARAIDLRFSEIRKSEYLDKEEVDVLSSLKDMSFTSWDKLSKEIGSEKAYGIVNSTLLDMAYKTAFIKKEQAIVQESDFEIKEKKFFKKLEFIILPPNIFLY